MKTITILVSLLTLSQVIFGQDTAYVRYPAHMDTIKFNQESKAVPGYLIRATSHNLKIITDDVWLMNDLLACFEDSVRYINLQYLNTKTGRVRHYTIYFPISMEDAIRAFLDAKYDRK